jgi:hypothetical protein
MSVFTLPRDFRTTFVMINFAVSPLDDYLSHPEAMTFYGGNDTKIHYTDKHVIIFSVYCANGRLEYPRKMVASLSAGQI